MSLFGRIVLGDARGSLPARAVRRPGRWRASSIRIRSICPTSARWRTFSPRVRRTSTPATARCWPTSIRQNRTWVPIAGIPATGPQRVHRDRGPALLHASRRRRLRHHAGCNCRLPARRVSGRLDDHAAARAQAVSLQRSLDLAQGAGSAAGDGDRAILYEGRDPRALSQPDLLRFGRVRNPSRRAYVFRRRRLAPLARAGRTARRAPRGTVGLFALRQPRARPSAAAARARAHGLGRLHHRGASRGRCSWRRSDSSASARRDCNRSRTRTSRRT